MDVTLICDAFCAAYTAEDFLQLELFADFLQTVHSSSSSSSSTTHKSFQALMQQVLLVADFEESRELACIASL